MESDRVNVESSTSDSEEESECEPTLPSSFEGGSDPNGPRKGDVLLGRGKPYQNFPGNRRMLRIISQFKSEYASRPRDQKRLYVETALEAVLKDGARFLRRVEVGDGTHRWEEVDRAAAAEKVWNALRSKGDSRHEKSRRTADQGDDHSNNDHPPAPSPLAVEMGANSTGSNVAYQPFQPMHGGIPVHHISLVQSLSNTLVQHLSNATITATLLAALTSGQIQPPQVPVPVVENLALPPVQDLSAQHILQGLITELLRAHHQGTVPAPLSTIQQPQPQHVATSLAVANAVASPRPVPPANPLVLPPSILGNQHGDPQQDQLIRQVMAALLQVREPANPPS